MQEEGGRKTCCLRPASSSPGGMGHNNVGVGAGEEGVPCHPVSRPKRKFRLDMRIRCLHIANGSAASLN